MRSVYLKELNLYFSSPIFYVLAGIFLMISGIFFYGDMVRESMVAVQIAQYQVDTPVGLTEVVLQPLFDGTSILVLFLIPMLAMRLYAEEKAQGTIELLFTYPVSDIAVLAGKYLAGLTVLAVMIAGTAVSVIILAAFSPVDWGVVLTSYLGLLCLGGALLAVGVFASSLTRNQIIAAVLTLGLILILWVIGGFADLAEGGLARVLQEISLIGHMDGFLKGMLTLKDIVFYAVFTLFFLFLTLRVLESHTWRG